MGQATRVELFPWDPDSPTHIERLVEQRVQCGWHFERVDPKWRKEQRDGTKLLFWIVLSSDNPEYEEQLQLHRTTCPKEADALEDTAASVRGTPREPSLQKIHPVGHITLDVDNTEASHLGLDLPDAGVYWIKTFYVSRVLQSKGVGRAAMDSIESIAVTEPICARTLALDTVHKDDQLPVNSNGQEPRKMTNQEWYSRRGYQLIKTVPNFYLNSPAPDGSVRESRTVFMKRNVV